MKFALLNGKWFKHGALGWTDQKGNPCDVNSRAKFFQVLPPEAPAWLREEKK